MWLLLPLLALSWVGRAQRLPVPPRRRVFAAAWHNADAGLTALSLRGVGWWGRLLMLSFVIPHVWLLSQWLTRRAAAAAAAPDGV
ncbi:MAG: hypothetical protein J3K34DRAFT_431105 [Monoraphidium minutum]|nr:MAG: hypothetical protein J3K34DRAFT_431105 [Monoraphidium minutum]